MCVMSVGCNAGQTGSVCSFLFLFVSCFFFVGRVVKGIGGCLGEGLGGGEGVGGACLLYITAVTDLGGHVCDACRV